MARLKTIASKALAPLAVGGLMLGAVSPANALLSDNVHNVAGGGVNIHADNTCVEKVGDTAHVKFEVQHQPLLQSSDYGLTSNYGVIALPHNMENVSIKIVAAGSMPIDATITDEEGIEQYAEVTQPVSTKYDTPVDVPIKNASDDTVEVPSIGEAVYSEKEIKNGNKTITHTVPTEQEMRDDIAERGVFIRKKHPSDNYDHPDTHRQYSGPFGSRADLAWYGNNIEDYDVYELGNGLMPLSFEIEGDIVVNNEDTFATGAVSNLGWKSSEPGFMGSYERGDQDLQHYAWARPGYLPPAVPEDEDMIQFYKEHNSNDGLDISPSIAPTKELSGNAKYRYIGTDARPSSRGDVGAEFTKAFTLHANRAVTYIGQVPQSGEDGADIAAAHVTLCPAEETSETETPETETPETETPETETPETETPETETPETETPETETPETETPETETPETETPETETPETETPETETPETETPETETPETETPETETPETETPETETPETKTPETETPESETSQRTLATTGASVIGITVVALTLIIGGIYLSRRKNEV